ncbi:MAG TPA: hypothetical protein VM778_11830 [Gemmatimonadota bacterium]|nr:hypothetical protein [Gemmatimonadota bacterium]
MPSRTIGITLMSAGLVVALSGPRVAHRAEPRGFAPADTVSANWLAEVTMEPIVAVLSHEDRLESVTMETIRVVIPVDEKREGSPR